MNNNHNLKEIIENVLNRKDSSEKNSSFFAFLFCMIAIVSILCYFLWSPETIVKKEIINDDYKEVVNQILMKPEEKKIYETNLQMFQSKLNNLKNEVNDLERRKEEIISILENKKLVIKNEMLLKKEIKESELNESNSEGYAQGFSDGIKKGEENASGSGFDEGLILGGYLFSK